ncbi:type I-E CRISPR-associated protein Cse1/CasA [Verticiella alkaliphila]|uniref:type I-E CRISPR-associated protein Cse1/CasA n=1 Tax=Verticiella alkaliphila TaxID=2779529 RepID=UPI001C0AA79C|nr:type I-E CRISPR-associated protein Cse1/CasA [Verticiella sp. GG226]
MNLLSDPWLRVRDAAGKIHRISPLQIGDTDYHDIVTDRPDFQGAVYQLLIGVLQITYAPVDKQEWKERWAAPPDAQTLRTFVAPILSAFELEADGPAFMQDADLPSDANQLSVLDLLIDAGSDSNLFFNKPLRRVACAKPVWPRHCSPCRSTPLQAAAGSEHRCVAAGR